MAPVQSRGALALASLLVVTLLTGAPIGAKAECVPYPLPDGVENYQAYCLSIMQGDTSYYSGLFDSSSGPTAGSLFPLEGAILGCIAGQSSISRAQAFGIDQWSGKVFSNWDSESRSGDVANIITPGNVMSTNWANGLPAFTYFPGKVTESSELLQTLGSSSGSGGAWKITYNVSALDTINPYGQIVGSTIDEVRYVKTGMMVGRTWAKPTSSLNPLPVWVNEGLYFVLFQVCGRDGQFVYTPTERYLGSTGITPGGSSAPPPPPPPTPSVFAFGRN